MITNLGQSKFQDEYFVAGAQLTPFRRLRQIELELRQLEDSIKRGSISRRRIELKLSKLDPSDPEQALDIEEAEWDLEQQIALMNDATSRRDNFLRMKEQLIQDVPAEYWAIGYENAEIDHWIAHFSQSVAFMQITGQYDQSIMKQIILMPPEAQQKIAIKSQEQLLMLTGSKENPDAIEVQHNPAKLCGLEP